MEIRNFGAINHLNIDADKNIRSAHRRQGKALWEKCCFSVTTHSPYILSSANLLIQSAMVENRVASKGEEVIVKKQLRIAPQKIAAYKNSRPQAVCEEKSLYNDPIVKRMKKDLANQYNGTLHIFEKNKEERYSDL